MVRCGVSDIHADPAPLARSLAVAAPEDGFAFPEDFIKAGHGIATPDDAAVPGVARGIVETGRAVAVTGNRASNAVLFHRTGKDGVPLRARSDKALAHHRSFCRSFGVGTPAALGWTRWFLTLPL